jgi:Na+/proline symporter
MGNLDEKYGEKCWDVANAITAFAAAQSIAFAIAAQSSEHLQKALVGHGKAAAVLIIIFSVAYGWAVYGLERMQRKLLPQASDNLQRVFRAAALSRMGGIAGFGLLSIAAVYRFM